MQPHLLYIAFVEFKFSLLIIQLYNSTKNIAILFIYLYKFLYFFSFYKKIFLFLFLSLFLSLNNIEQVLLESPFTTASGPEKQNPTFSQDPSSAINVAQLLTIFFSIYLFYFLFFNQQQQHQRHGFAYRFRISTLLFFGICCCYYYYSFLLSISFFFFFSLLHRLIF